MRHKWDTTFSCALFILIFWTTTLNSLPYIRKDTGEKLQKTNLGFGTVPTGPTEIPQMAFGHTVQRTKRSPFIMAFQVTKPPGMFQMGLRPPYIMNMMSNLTRSLFSSSLAQFLMRGFTGQTTNNSSNATIIDGIRSRQEDLEIFDK